MANRIEFTTNGKAKKATTTRPTKAEKDARARRQLVRQRLAMAVGGIGVSAIGLSVVHVTDAITTLTGSHWVLSGMLAIAIDAGMVSAELAELIGHDDADVVRWAKRYTLSTIALSMLLNSFAYAGHAKTPFQVGAGIILGLTIPACVFMLGRIAGHLYQGKGD